MVIPAGSGRDLFAYEVLWDLPTYSRPYYYINISVQISEARKKSKKKSQARLYA